MQAGERKQRAAVPHPELAAAVQALQALHQELDIADAAGRQLDIQAGVRPRLAASFSLMRSRVSETASTARKSSVRRVDQRLDEFQQFAAQGQVAGAHARLDQHLLFPVARALLVVAFGAVERNADLAQAAVGPQPQIHAVARAIRGVCGKQLGVLIGDLLEEFLVGDGAPARRFRRCRSTRTSGRHRSCSSAPGRPACPARSRQNRRAALAIRSLESAARHDAPPIARESAIREIQNARRPGWKARR